MGLTIDTSVLVATERGRIDFAALLEAESKTEPPLISVLVASELLHGLERANAERRQIRRAYVDRVLERFELIAFDLECARVHGQIWARLESSGERIGYHDLIIAATALAHGHRIATLNVGEFSRIYGLTMVDASACSIQ